MADTERAEIAGLLDARPARRVAKQIFLGPYTAYFVSDQQSGQSSVPDGAESKADVARPPGIHFAVLTVSNWDTHRGRRCRI